MFIFTMPNPVRPSSARGLLALVAGATLLSSPPVFAGPPVSDDFNSGDLAGWTFVDPIRGTNFEVADGGLSITTAALPPLDAWVGAGGLLNGSLADPAAYSNGTVRATVRLNNADTNVQFVLRGNTEGTSGYAYFLNGVSQTIGINDLSGGTLNIVAAPMALEAGVDYHLEARSVGSRHTITVRPAGGDPCAATTLSVQDTAHSAGVTSFIVYNQPTQYGGNGGALDVTLDDFTFTPATWTLAADFARDGIDAWTPIDLTADLDPQFDLLDGRMVISTPGGAGNNDHAVLLYSDSEENAPYYADGTIRATVLTVNTNVSLITRAAGVATTALTFRPTDGVLLIIEYNGMGGAPILAFADTDYVDGEDLVMEFIATGTLFQGRVWRMNEPRPAKPLVVATGLVNTSGAIGIMADGPAVGGGTPLYGEFGDIWFLPSVPADLNGDGIVNGADLGLLLAGWGTCTACPGCPGDLNGDGVVDGADLGLLLSDWT